MAFPHVNLPPGSPWPCWAPFEAAITFPTMAFCLLGTFAPDNGQFLARTTIGNLGLYVVARWHPRSHFLDPS
jgi:hypothetical protein